MYVQYNQYIHSYNILYKTKTFLPTAFWSVQENGPHQASISLLLSHFSFLPVIFSKAWFSKKNLTTTQSYYIGSRVSWCTSIRVLNLPARDKLSQEQKTESKASSDQQPASAVGSSDLNTWKQSSKFSPPQKGSEISFKVNDWCFKCACILSWGHMLNNWFACVIDLFMQAMTWINVVPLEMIRKMISY